MDTNIWEPLFYDKYDNISKNVYHNTNTKKIKYNNLAGNSKYTYLTGEDAIGIFNVSYSGYKIPKLSNELYFVEVYYCINDEGILKEFYTVIGVNKKYLLGRVSKDKHIPQESFLTKLCKNDLSYKHGKIINASDYITTVTQKVNSISKDVMSSVMKPVKYNPKIQTIPDPKYITATLYNYQRSSLEWMLKKEKTQNRVYYSESSNAMKIGDVGYDIENNKYTLCDGKGHVKFYGGGVIDQVGMGKTLLMITLSLLNPPRSIKWFQTKRNKKRLFARGTLVICPSHLCGQWKREIGNMVSKSYDVNIISILTKVHFKKYTYQDLMNADFVIVSFNFIANKAFTSLWEPSRNYHKNNYVKKKDVDNVFNILGNGITDKVSVIKKKNCLFPLIHWHRLVIDEFHEIHSNKKYVAVKNLVPSLCASHKWCVTGTPFIKDDSLYNMVAFLNNYQSKLESRMLMVPEIVEYLKKDCFRRNTKDSVVEEYTLPPVKQEVVWLNFSPTERMMYDAYLANVNNDHKQSVYLRKLCCHPNLSAETRNALSSCKSMKDIENMMTKHYLKDVQTAENKVEGIQLRIDLISTKIKELEKAEKNKRLGIKDNTISNNKIDDILKLVLLGQDSLTMGYDIDIINNTTTTFVLDLDELRSKLKHLKGRLEVEKKRLDGKRTTYNFFKSVTERLRKLTENNDSDDDNDYEEIDQGSEAESDDELLLESDVDASDDDEEQSIFTSSEAASEELDDQSENESEDEDGLESESDLDEESDNENECSICLDDVPPGDIGVTKCGHIFCYDCLKSIIQLTPTCPHCRSKLTSKDIYQVSIEEHLKKKKLTGKEKNKQELIDKVGTKLANLIYYIKDSSDHCILFSQWDDLLKKVGIVLKNNGVKNVFCKGNVYQRDKAIREFNTNENIKVIMLSSQSAASGTNLTKAKKVIFLDPIYGEYKYRKDTEDQAIGRAHRLGQKNNLKVVKFIIKKSVEEDIYYDNLEQDKKNTKKPVAKNLYAFI